jgi:hypothetical protein
MEVVPISVGAALRAWDEQHLDVAAAADQVGGAPTAGFTAAVAGAASRFVTGWQRHTSGLADAAERRADTLRTVVADYLATDEVASFEALVLLAYLQEQR